MRVPVPLWQCGLFVIFFASTTPSVCPYSLFWCCKLDPSVKEGRDDPLVAEAVAMWSRDPVRHPLSYHFHKNSGMTWTELKPLTYITVQTLQVRPWVLPTVPLSSSVNYTIVCITFQRGHVFINPYLAIIPNTSLMCSSWDYRVMYIWTPWPSPVILVIIYQGR